MKKIQLKKKVVEAPLEINFIPACNMEDGVEYVNAALTCIIKIKEYTPYEGYKKGIEALRDSKVCYTGESDMGECLSGHMSALHPVLTDVPELIEKIRHSGKIYQGHIKAASVVKAAQRPPKVDVNGNVIERKPRGDKDPLTGCMVGTTGHEMGKIMLESGFGNRVEAVAKMTTWLEQQFEPKKAKALAQSWYSTNMLRKSEIYGNEKNYK